MICNRLITEEKDMQLKHFGLAVLVAASLALPVRAHHSHSSYVITDFLTLEGTIKTIYFLNPHSWIYLDVKDSKGAATLWTLEGDDVVTLFKSGVKKGDVLPGDTIRVRCYRARDETPNCLLKYLTPLHGDSARGHGVEQDWD
jgi:hypothetical protein